MHIKPTGCPTFVCVECPVCGLFVGDQYVLHPPAEGVKFDEKLDEDKELDRR